MADTNSWAYKQARSADHMALITEMILEEAQQRLELFHKMFPRLLPNQGEYNHTLGVIIDKLRGGSDRQGQDLQNLEVVGSTPTPRSKDFDLREPRKGLE